MSSLRYFSVAWQVFWGGRGEDRIRIWRVWGMHTFRTTTLSRGKAGSRGWGERPRRATPVASKPATIRQTLMLQPLLGGLIDRIQHDRHALGTETRSWWSTALRLCLVVVLTNARLNLFLRCPGFVLRPSFIALGDERNDWNLYFTDGGSDYEDPYTEDTTFDSTVSTPGFYW